MLTGAALSIFFISASSSQNSASWRCTVPAGATENAQLNDDHGHGQFKELNTVGAIVLAPGKLIDGEAAPVPLNLAGLNTSLQMKRK